MVGQLSLECYWIPILSPPLHIFPEERLVQFNCIFKKCFHQCLFFAKPAEKFPLFWYVFKMDLTLHIRFCASVVESKRFCAIIVGRNFAAKLQFCHTVILLSSLVSCWKVVLFKLKPNSFVCLQHTERKPETYWQTWRQGSRLTQYKKASPSFTSFTMLRLVSDRVLQA